MKASARSIITGFFLILGLCLFAFSIYSLRSVLMLLFVSLILASAIHPLVRWGSQRRIPRPVTILVVYALLLSAIGAMLGVIIPPLIKETGQLIVSVSHALGVSELSINGLASLDFSKLASSFDQYRSLAEQFTGSLGSAIQMVFSTFSAAFVFITLLVMTFYLLLSMDHFATGFAWALPGTKVEKLVRAQKMLLAIQVQLGSWVRGQLLLMFVIGVVTYIGLMLLGIPYALPLAILAGLLEILPNIGPIIASIPSIFIAFFVVNPVTAFLTMLFYLLVQQAENIFIVPKIMKAAVDVPPLITIILMMVGFELLGVLGALLAIPFFITVRTVVRELWPDQGPFMDFSDLTSEM